MSRGGEGFRTTCDEFDPDITAEPLPRAAFALTDDALMAVCVDGRAPDESGLLLPELAELLFALGARSALNLDGGSSSALVTAGVMRNAPRDDEGEVLMGGYPTRTLVAIDAID